MHISLKSSGSLDTFETRDVLDSEIRDFPSVQFQEKRMSPYIN